MGDQCELMSGVKLSELWTPGPLGEGAQLLAPLPCPLCAARSLAQGSSRSSPAQAGLCVPVEWRLRGW